MPGTDTISIFRGEDAVLQFTAVNPDDTSVAADITGWTLVFTVRSATDTVEKTPTITSAAEGEFEVQLERDDTVDLSPGRYTYDVWRTNDGEQYPIAVGVFVVARAARD